MGFQFVDCHRMYFKPLKYGFKQHCVAKGVRSASEKFNFVKRKSPENI